jgi:hypothetical protein
MSYKSKLIFAVSLFTACTLVAVSAVAQSKTAPQLASPTGNVVVVNGTGQPVPTAAQGTTNVAGTVNVGNTPNVTVANTPNVNVVNTPSVSIAGTPTVTLAPGGSTNVTNPLDGQNNPNPLAVLEAIQPYEDGCGMSITSGISGNCNFQQIPAGKRLIIEEFDAKGFMDAGVKPIDLSVTVSGLLSHFFPATFMGTQGLTDYFATHQPTRLYSAAVFQPVCGVTLTATANFATYDCRLSGFLVDVQ